MCFFCVAQIFPHGDNWSSGPITAPGASISPDDGPCLCPRVQPMGFLLCFPPAYQQQTRSCWRRTERWSFSNFVFFFNYPNFFCVEFLICFKFLVRNFAFYSAWETSFTDTNPTGAATWDVAHPDGSPESQKVGVGVDEGGVKIGGGHVEAH